MTVVVERAPETSHAIFKRILLQCELPQERAYTRKVTETISWDGGYIFNWLEHVGIVASYIMALKVQSHRSSAVLYPESFNMKYVKFLFFPQKS